jgi:Maltokinase N-terminal cap domain
LRPTWPATMPGMAILHPQADLRPSKLELLTPWLPTHAWYRGKAEPELSRIAGYRFDDPAGEVGIETLLIQAGDGPLYQVPLTYRGAPLDGHGEWLVGTMEHSVLGPRWVYDACGDPVYASVLATTILTGAAGAEEFNSVNGREERREPSMTVRGSGNPASDATPVSLIVSVEDGEPTLVVTDSVALAIRRALDPAGGPTLAGSAGVAGPADPGGHEVLTGTWAGVDGPVLLATVQPLS